MIFHTIPDAQPSDIIEWAERINLKVDGHSFDSKRFPQLIEPIRSMSNPSVRIGTLMKPIQTGGSTVGEVVAAFWCSFWYGLIQYNWQDDGEAKWRWDSRILKMLESCADLRWVGGPYDRVSCLGKFVNSTLLVQGVEAKGALDSETIPFQINEEIHLWKPGHLAKARGRQTIPWNSKALDISNAGIVDDQLHKAYQDGSMSIWEVLCPGCKQYHVMRFRWEEKHPELGGLRFDTNVGKNEMGRYNLTKLIQTIRYQMPCGFIVHDTPAERRALVGRYRVTNDGALKSHPSWNYDASSVQEVKWPDLTLEWLTAARAIKSGDDVPMMKFVQERECRPWSTELIPFTGITVVNKMAVKSREGLEGRVARLWFADKQKGYAHKGEFVHYWLVIRDVMENCDSQLVFEGLCQTDADLIARLDEHKCHPQAGAIDRGWDSENVMQLCYRNNFNAQITSNQDKLFYHTEEKVYRIFSKPDGLHKQLNVPPKFSYTRSFKDGQVVFKPSASEPMHWSIHLIGSIKLLNFLRGHKQLVEHNGGTDYIKWDVPGDVSDHYLKQIDSWEFGTRTKPGTSQQVEVCRQRLNDDHMLKCEAGIACIMSMAPHPKHPHLSILAVRLAKLGLTESVIGNKNETEK